MKTKQRKIRERRERAWRAGEYEPRPRPVSVEDLCAALKLLGDAADGAWFDGIVFPFSPEVIVRGPHA